MIQPAARHSPSQLPSPRPNPPEKTSSPLKDFFLPSNFPESVRSDYPSSRVWKASRHVESAFVGYLSTIAALQAAGVGSGPLGMSLALMLRDGAGNVGRTIASLHAKQADLDPKGLSRKGEVLESAGHLAESGLAMFPGAFLAVAPAAQIIKAWGGSYKEAAHPVLVNPQATADNLGEVTAKNQLQENLASVAGGMLAFAADQALVHHFGPVALPLLVAAGVGLRYLSMQQFLKVTGPPQGEEPKEPSKAD